MERLFPEVEIVRELPIRNLPEGEIGPPLDPDHPTWDRLGEWFDPLASRGGYRRDSLKTRVTMANGEPAIDFATMGRHEHDRCLLAGEAQWRDYHLECRVQALQGYGLPNTDAPLCRHSRTGLVFRMATVRHYYFFGIESQQRLVLAYRCDDTWHELAGAEVAYEEQPVTLSVDLNGDGIAARCPELEACFRVTDTRLPTGLAGFRSLGACRLLRLFIGMTPEQNTKNVARVDHHRETVATREKGVADAVKVAEIRPPDGGALSLCADFCAEGRNDLLFWTPEKLAATAWDGTVLWELAESVSQQNAKYVALSGDRMGPGRIIFVPSGNRREEEHVSVVGAMGKRVVANEIIAIDGHTGTVRARRRLPDVPYLDIMRNFDVSVETGALSGPGQTDVIVREWRKDCGGGGRKLWAYNADLELLWEAEVDPPYGHHNAVHIAHLGLSEGPVILAGGTLLNAKGETLWVHDAAAEMRAWLGAGHYDACLIGNFSEDAEQDPVAFLAGGSAGVYVVDGLTGETRAVHRVGHAQWLTPCEVRNDAPGKQVLSGTRWGNYGILTLLSGRGERLWSIQPEYVLQGTQPVRWHAEGPQLIWLNRTRSTFGLTDGQGRLVSRLAPMREFFTAVTKAPCQVLRPTPGSLDHLAIQPASDAPWHVFQAEKRSCCCM